jgi:hypothetical protein
MMTSIHSAFSSHPKNLSLFFTNPLLDEGELIIDRTNFQPLTTTGYQSIYLSQALATTLNKTG